MGTRMPEAADRVAIGCAESTPWGMASSIQSYNAGMSKVMVSIADDLLARIDAEAKRRSTSRSALLAAAAQRELARRDNDLVAAAVERSEKRFQSAGAFEAGDLVRADRDTAR